MSSQARGSPECGLLPPPLAYKASVSNPDSLSYDEAMAIMGNVERWMEAARKEIASLEKNGTWLEVNASEAKSRILPGTWVFKRKRTPDGEISKYKARYGVRGDLEEGEPFESSCKVGNVLMGSSAAKTENRIA